MAEDKKLFYHILKNLHFQTEYLHFIYRSTNRETAQQRKANFWRVAQIPSIIVAILNIYILFFAQDWIVGGLTISISFIIVICLGIYIYNRFIKKINKKEEDIMNFNSILIFIQNSRDQVEIIDAYKIENMEAIKKSKLDEIEDIINDDLGEIFSKFDGKSKLEVEGFLKTSGLSFSRFKGRLERLKTFMVEKSKGYESRNSYNKIIAMIKYLQDLENNDMSQIGDLMKIFLKRSD